MKKLIRLVYFDAVEKIQNPIEDEEELWCEFLKNFDFIDDTVNEITRELCEQQIENFGSL